MDRSRQARGLTHPGPAPSAAGGGSPTLADTLQGLQRSAGNRAVGEILGLDAGGAPQNVPGSRAVIPGIGTIPLESVQFGRLKRPPGRGAEEKPEGDEQPGGEMIFVSKQGRHSSLLHRALLDGTAADVEVVIVSSRGAVLRLMLKGAIVSSYQPSSAGGGDPLESWSLDFESMTQSIEGAAGE